MNRHERQLLCTLDVGAGSARLQAQPKGAPPATWTGVCRALEPDLHLICTPCTQLNGAGSSKARPAQHLSEEVWPINMSERPQKITFGELRAQGCPRILVYCADYTCSHSINDFRTLFGSLVVSEIALLLRLCGDEGVSTLLRVLRRLFIVDQVMPENVERLFRGHVEDMGSAGIDNDLEIGFTSDGLTVRGWCPVVFLANQDESANRWVDAVVAERIVGDDPCDPAVPARSIL